MDIIRRKLLLVTIGTGLDAQEPQYLTWVNYLRISTTTEIIS